MRANDYVILSRAVEEGARCGWRRAHKHGDGSPPSEEMVVEHVEREVMNAICEVFQFSEQVE
jgi:hypothetical protein